MAVGETALSLPLRETPATNVRRVSGKAEGRAGPAVERRWLAPNIRVRAIRPEGLILLSIISVQIGAALAKGLFPALGPGGTVFLRIGVAALVLLLLERPQIRGVSRVDMGMVILFGLVIAAMNASFYAAIARLPLGIAVTLEFVGPLAVAVAGSRRRLDLIWGGLAAVGIVLLAPTGHASLDPLGVLLALLAGAGWAGYILLNVQVGRVFTGHSGLALAMGVSAIAIAPFGLGASGALLAHPWLLVGGAGVGLLSTVIPFSLEHSALKRISARVFGVLMSLEPAVAALVGAVFLHEGLGLRGLLALVCVTIASGGSARS